jgi:hypothetical protein
LADFIKFLAFSGARRQAGLSAKWSQVDWNNRQLTLFTKFDKRVVVDFNEKLEAHLTDLKSRRASADEPWIFPSPRRADTPTADNGFFASPQKLLMEVRVAAGMPEFRFHDLRHWFASYAVMSGIDTLTVAAWLGHSDGGVLIGKTYGHLNPQHKRDAADKLRFTPQAAAAQTAPPTCNPPLPQVQGLDLSKLTVADLMALVSAAQGLGKAQAGSPPATLPEASSRPDEPSAVAPGENQTQQLAA